MKKKQPLVMPVEKPSDHIPFPQVTLDTNKFFDHIHIRNTYIRAMNDALKDCEVNYNARISYLSRKWFSSPKSIERVINSNLNNK